MASRAMRAAGRRARAAAPRHRPAAVRRRATRPRRATRSTARAPARPTRRAESSGHRTAEAGRGSPLGSRTRRSGTGRGASPPGREIVNRSGTIIRSSVTPAGAVADRHAERRQAFARPMPAPVAPREDLDPGQRQEACHQDPPRRLGARLIVPADPGAAPVDRHADARLAAEVGQDRQVLDRDAGTADVLPSWGHRSFDSGRGSARIASSTRGPSRRRRIIPAISTDRRRGPPGTCGRGRRPARRRGRPGR